MLAHSMDMPVYLFHQGTNYHAQELMGSHLIRRGRGWATVFRVWAPNAAGVSVVGDFNGWDPQKDPMTKITEQGLWEGVTRRLKNLDLYKFAVTTKSGELLYKSDPYARYCEAPPQTASRFYPPDGYVWGDGDWMRRRAGQLNLARPVNIYEVHAGSGRTRAGEALDYAGRADELVPYAAGMGYTHIELLPLAEHPYDGSWGYQTTGYFAPTVRYGPPNGLKACVDRCHQAGVGVLLDWVGGHFPRDAHGLYRFDGQPLYEYADPLKGEQPQWGTQVFDFGRNEVQCFLVSNALYWIEEFHFDGLRVDGVAAMLYLDYGRMEGQWRPNAQGGRENLEALAFLRKLNSEVLSRHADVMMIAEESTAWPLVTRPPYTGGLGFSFKWNMGWMNDLLSYVRLDPAYRRYHHDKLTFGLLYAFSENYILPVSHDEVVHGKLSLIGRMPGDYELKFSGVRAFLGFMMAHPGKKLSFMGSEFGQFIEWDYQKELDWLLLDYPAHRALQTYVKRLNRVYLERSELYEIDNSWEGFRWIVLDDNTQNILSFARFDERGDFILVLVNFSPIGRDNYRIGVPKEGCYRELLNSDDAKFGGKGVENGTLQSQDIPYHGMEQSVQLRVPAMSCVYFEYAPENSAPREMAAGCLGGKG